MRIAVLFDGAGLARLGLEQAGHECIGVELDPVAHHLGQFVGEGECLLGDVRGDTYMQVVKDWADAVWASPPCQKRSSARTQGEPTSDYSEDLLEWSLGLRDRYPHLKTLWVENIKSQKAEENTWGTLWNAAQFGSQPKQNRQRVIGGEYPNPTVQRAFKTYYRELDLCPCVTATEYKGCASDKRRASRYYGRKLTLQEVAFHMGMPIHVEPVDRVMQIDDTYDPLEGYVPEGWKQKPEWFLGTNVEWRNAQYTALGNGVPVWMAKAFGTAAKEIFG